MITRIIHSIFNCLKIADFIKIAASNLRFELIAEMSITLFYKYKNWNKYIKNVLKAQIP